MSIKKAYYYLYYKLYNFFEKGPTVWFSDLKAIAVIGVLIVFVIVTLAGYIEMATKASLIGSLPTVVVIGIFITAFCYFTFRNDTVLKNYKKEFDKWPKQKNKIGSAVVLIVILFIIANLIFMFYQYSKIDWRHFK